MERSKRAALTSLSGRIDTVHQMHAHAGLRLLEGLGRGNYEKIRQTFEKWFISEMYSPFERGAIRSYYDTRRHVGGSGVPFLDGRALTWYYTFATHPETVREIWGHVVKQIDRRQLERPPVRFDSAAPNELWGNSNIPFISEVAALYPVAAQVGDVDSSQLLRRWIAEYFPERIVDEQKKMPVTSYLTESVEWSFLNTAHYLLGLAVEAGSNLRAMYQNQPKGDLPEDDIFTRPYVDSIEPWYTSVYQATWVAQEMSMTLSLELKAYGSRRISIVLRNARRVEKVTGCELIGSRVGVVNRIIRLELRLRDLTRRYVIIRFLC